LKIDAYSFGHIVIEGKSYTKDVIIFTRSVFSPWWRKEGHYLYMEDIEAVIREKPHVLIVGKGYSGVMEVPQSLVRKLSEMGMEVIVERTSEAVKTFNDHEGKNVVAALHLTC
jgi:hypothetical protein